MTGIGRLTGRLGAGPSQVWDEEVLKPQFETERHSLLDSYVSVEKALLVESNRLGVVDEAGARRIAASLSRLRPRDVSSDAQVNMSDIAFAIEGFVRRSLGSDAPAWHVDRSRNDMQACAQVMFSRSRLLDLAAAMVDLVEAVVEKAGPYIETPMPGYTHFQPAQVITPGFYLSALADELLHVLRRLAGSYRELDMCPLGAGAMAGQELPWDRARLAALLGFAAPQRHALVAVASRSWVLGMAGDLSMFGVALSRFATDLIAWGSGPYGFLELPDQLCGISSAMPQKRNYPILERIRGRTSHLTSFYLDLAMGQRNTPYTNMVEVSKEAGTHLKTLLASAESVLRLTSTVTSQMRFRTSIMAGACEADFLGGFSLANELTLREGLDWREAQVVAGRYISAALEAGARPSRPEPALLRSVAQERGHKVATAEESLAAAFDPENALSRKLTVGSTHPDRTRRMLRAQADECAEHRADWLLRRERLSRARDDLDTQLGLSPSPPSESTGSAP